MSDWSVELPTSCARYPSLTAAELTVEVRGLARLLARAERDSKRLALARGALGTDASRARRTTAVAKWHRAAEERDRFQLMLDAATAALAVITEAA